MAERKTGSTEVNDWGRLEESRMLVAGYLDKLKVCRNGLIRRHGQPDDESVWPIVLSLDSEKVRLADRSDTLVWLTGSRVVAEEFYPSSGKASAGWRRVVDVDVVSGDIVTGWEDAPGKMILLRENAIETASPICNAPGVYAAQIANRIYSSRLVEM